MLIHGDCIEVMREMPEASVDSIVTDPPYGISFMGKAWDGEDIQRKVNRHAAYASKRPPRDDGRKVPRDSQAMHAGVYDRSTSANQAYQEWCTAWAVECLCVLKPGGYLLASGGTRTYHRLACAIEDAGFEIRDCIQWIYGSGFPKSKNLGNGFGTALKPAHEPIVLARKPVSEKSVTANFEEHGTGTLNIDASRISSVGDHKRPYQPTNNDRNVLGKQAGFQPTNAEGRWPANLILSHSPECNGECVEGCPVRELDRQSGNRKSGTRAAGARKGMGFHGANGGGGPAIEGSEGGSSRFFLNLEGEPGFRYVAKASGKERGESNNHPTVKPLALMRYLVRLVTPPGGVVLDPFAGSGTTGVACIEEGFEFVGIERESEYVEIAERRIADALECEQQKPLVLEV